MWIRHYPNPTRCHILKQALTDPVFTGADLRFHQKVIRNMSLASGSATYSNDMWLVAVTAAAPIVQGGGA
jgi:hypothetical protein